MRLSIIIPTLDEEEHLGPTLEQALQVADEVCVSDGGSRDGTVELARRLGARVVVGGPGRGGQLNRGAETCSGDVLLFLHADTRLPEAARADIEAQIGQGRVGGGFHARYETGPSYLLGPGNWLIRRRTAWTGCPLGDQCQFVRRDVFEEMGGFQPWPILEDLDFIHRLRRQGQIALLDGPALTSARRFESQGVVRTTATNWWIWTLYFLGVPPRSLARFYGRGRRSGEPDGIA